tara:strand:+ start:517 stop:753 length:237 start_codon:yes stop_codon:yes gene_type:complete
MIMKNILTVASEVFEVNEKDLSQDTKLNEIENWDSLKFMAFIISIEEKFSVNLDGDQIASLLTLGDLERVLSDNDVNI